MSAKYIWQQKHPSAQFSISFFLSEMFMCLVVFEIIIYLWIAIYIPFIFVQQTTFKHFAAIPFHTFQYDEKTILSFFYQ